MSTDSVISRIVYLRESGLDWEKIGEQVGLSAEAVRKRYGRYRAKYPEGEPDPGETAEIDEAFSGDEIRLVFEANEKEQASWRDIISLAISSQDIAASFDDSQRIATVRVVTDKVFGFIYSGDWHLGDGYTDHKRWTEDIQDIISYPFLKMVDLGDSYQNMRTFKVLSGVLGQAIPPQLQARLMKGIVDELTERGVLVAKVDGNHDAEFDERIFGESLQSYLVANMKAPRFRNRGLLVIEVVDPDSGRVTARYTNLLFHKSRFKSFLRATHGAYREYQLSFPADVIAGAHDHEPGFEIMHHYTLADEAGMDFGGESFLIKVGTYQDSVFGWKYFHNGGFPFNAAVIYWPTERKKVFMPSIREAIDYLKYLHGVTG